MTQKIKTLELSHAHSKHSIKVVIIIIDVDLMKLV